VVQARHARRSKTAALSTSRVSGIQVERHGVPLQPGERRAARHRQRRATPRDASGSHKRSGGALSGSEGIFGAGHHRGQQSSARTCPCICCRFSAGTGKGLLAHPEDRQRFAAEVSQELDVPCRVVDTARAAAEGTDIFAALTSSRIPVLDDESWIEDGGYTSHPLVPRVRTRAEQARWHSRATQRDVRSRSSRGKGRKIQDGTCRWKGA